MAVFRLPWHPRAHLRRRRLVALGTSAGAPATGTTTDGLLIGDVVTGVRARAGTVADGILIGDAHTAVTSATATGTTTDGVLIGDVHTAVRARTGLTTDGVNLGDLNSAQTTAVVGTPLTIDASLVTIREGGHNVRYEPMADEIVRNFRGKVISAIATGRTHRRVWNFHTADMSRAAAASFEADITTGNVFTITGFLVGSATLTACIANVNREDESQHASFTFELFESATG